MEQDEIIGVLCECLRNERQYPLQERLKQLTSSDWEVLLGQAAYQRVSPLLYYRFKMCESEPPIPRQVFRHLQTAYLTEAARNTYLYHELSQVLNLLQREAIPVVVLKGGYLAECVYRNIALRSLSDFDLLIRRQDLARAQRLLLAAGYGPGNPRLPLDLHWNLDLSIAHLAIDIDAVWERTQPASIAGVEVLALAPEDCLIHLCLHLASHHLFQFAGLRTLCDIRKVIERFTPQLQWEHVWQRTHEWGGSNAVCLSLLLAHERLGVPIPQHVMRKANSGNFERQKSWAIEQMFAKDEESLKLSPYFWQLWKPGPLREKLHTLKTLLLPKPEYVAQKYPVSLGSIRNYLYYSIRLKEHAWPYIKVLWHILMHDKTIRTCMQHQRRHIAMREWLISGETGTYKFD